MISAVRVEMMKMRILKPGRKQSGWATEETCTGLGNGGGGCEARLLVEQKDLFRTFRHSVDETADYVTFECSSCKVWTDLGQKNRPPYEIVSLLPNATTWADAKKRKKPLVGR